MAASIVPQAEELCIYQVMIGALGLS
jgi:hypothetical protein